QLRRRRLTVGRPPRKRRRPGPASPNPSAPKRSPQKEGDAPKPTAKGKAARSKGGRAIGGRSSSTQSPTRTEVSAGGVVYRRQDDGVEVILAARRTRRGDLAWGLAKGGIEADETTEQAAIREVREETGIEAEIETSLGETRYFYVWEDVRIRKTVHFFLMRATGGDPNDRDDEMEDVKWFPLERALKRAAYRGEREVLGRAAEHLR
ncbi:MAG: NUDIX hydrolase, partial [Actinomycetota bacterium]